MLNITDHEGTLLVRHPAFEDWIGRRMPEQPLLAAMRRQASGVVESAGVDGVQRVYAFIEVTGPGNTNVYLSIGRPRELVLAAADHQMARSVLWVALFAALTLSITWLGLQVVILEPLEKLLATTNRLAEGDLGARTGLPHQAGEVGAWRLGWISSLPICNSAPPSGSRPRPPCAIPSASCA